MADVKIATDKTIIAEGGYILHTVPGDTGGMTFAGIARNKNPQWAGWPLIDKKDMAGARALVPSFYKGLYWDPIGGDKITSQAVAENIFDYAVNAGVGTAAKTAQTTVGVVADGAIGPKTIAAFNAMAEAEFHQKFAMEKIIHYVAICNKNKDQSKFLLGWLNRTLAKLKG